MKKLFVSSAVFAAGTFASFAAVNFTDANGETWKFANDWISSTKVRTSYGSGASDDHQNIFSSNATTITGSWTISFNLSISGDNNTTNKGLISTRTWPGSSGIPSGYILYYNDSTNTLGYSTRDLTPTVVLSGVDLNKKISFSYIETNSVSGYGFFVISNNGKSVASSLINTGTNADLSASQWVNSVGGSSQFWTYSRHYQFSNIALSYSDEIPTTVIPEPSMFGLFAGLGVLAFAGTRRRRK